MGIKKSEYEANNDLLAGTTGLVLDGNQEIGYEANNEAKSRGQELELMEALQVLISREFGDSLG